jgi:hypothetical protein
MYRFLLGETASFRTPSKGADDLTITITGSPRMVQFPRNAPVFTEPISSQWTSSCSRCEESCLQSPGTFCSTDCPESALKQCRGKSSVTLYENEN